MQGTRFHLERPRVSHPQFPHHEREHSLGIRLAQKARRHLNIVTPYHFKRDLERKQIHDQVVPRVKQYGLVFDKRVIDVTTRSSYPYGYERVGNELDLLLDL